MIFFPNPEERLPAEGAEATKDPFFLCHTRPADFSPKTQTVIFALWQMYTQKSSAVTT